MDKPVSHEKNLENASLFQVTRAAEGYLNCIAKCISEKGTKNSLTGKVAASLFLNMISQHSAIIYIAKSEHTSQLPTLLRSMFESLADLLNVLRSESYALELEMNDAIETETMAKTALEQKEHLDPQTIFILEEIKAKSEEKKNSINTKTGTKIKKIKIVDKIERAGLKESYAIYRSLCSFSHNQITALSIQHIDDDNYLTLRPLTPMFSKTIVHQAKQYIEMAARTINSFIEISEAEMNSNIATAEVVWHFALISPE